MSTTFEEASRCPKCGEPGEKGKEIQPDPAAGALPHGAKLIEVWCRNGDKAFSKDCNWYNTPWLVQINADGSVPEPTDHRGEPKLYTGDFGTDAEAQQVINQLQEAALRETKPGAELRNPYA